MCGVLSFVVTALNWYTQRPSKDHKRLHRAKKSPKCKFSLRRFDVRMLFDGYKMILRSNSKMPLAVLDVEEGQGPASPWPFSLPAATRRNP